MTHPNTDQLRANVRFLGRILGEVIKAQDGQALFDRIEEIRKASVAFHWGPEAGSGESDALQAKLAQLDLPDTVRFVHSFACFLQMANIAEDQVQRTRARRGAGGVGRPDTLTAALTNLHPEGVGAEAVAAMLDDALLAPIITAHP